MIAITFSPNLSAIEQLPASWRRTKCYIGGNAKRGFVPCYNVLTMNAPRSYTNSNVIPICCSNFSSYNRNDITTFTYAICSSNCTSFVYTQLPSGMPSFLSIVCTKCETNY